MYCTIAVNSALRAAFSCSMTFSFPCMIVPSVLRYFAVSASRDDVIQRTRPWQARTRRSGENLTKRSDAAVPSKPSARKEQNRAPKQQARPRRKQEQDQAHNSVRHVAISLDGGVP